MQQEPFDVIELERLPREVAWISSVRALAVTASTNDEAATMARDGAPEGTVVVADRQTAGRGRMGRSWIAPAGVALHCSWIVRAPLPADQRPLLGLAAAVAAASAIEQESGAAVSLKWPNDLLGVSGRKLGGILAESLPDGAVVVGLGVNVRQDAFDDELAPIATSLLMERSRPVGRARLLGAILNSFAPFAGAPAACLDEYRRRCVTIGAAVRVEQPAGALDGVAEDVDDTGALLVASAGAVHRIAAGDVVHLRPAAR